MTITKSNGAIDSADYLQGHEGVFVGYRVSHEQAGHWKKGTGDGFKIENSFYINNAGGSPSYEITIEVGGENFDTFINVDDTFTSGYESGGVESTRAEGEQRVKEIPDKIAPKVSKYTIVSENTSAGSPYLIKLIHNYEDHNDTDYDGEPWEHTGIFDVSGATGADDWSLFEQDRACSSYLLKYILANNMNKIAYESRQNFSTAIVPHGRYS
jgi:hypothetical protein